MKGFGGVGQAPVSWWGRSTQAGPLWPVHHRARFSLSPPPIPTRAGPCGQSPFPSLPSQVCTGQRKGGDPGCKQAADTQFYLALRLSPLEKPTSSTRAGEPLTPGLSAPLGPRSECPWGQGWVYTAGQSHRPVSCQDRCGQAEAAWSAGCRGCWPCPQKTCG